jgi:MFS family permease
LPPRARPKAWAAGQKALRRAQRNRKAISGSQLHGGAAYLAIAGLLIYTGSFAIGLGPVFWLLISEIYPVTIRGQAMSVATMANWGANFVVTISFLTLLSAIGNAGTFFLFAGLSVVALAYFQRQVPETKNRSLQDIERDLDMPERHDDLRQRPVSRAHP